MVDNMKNQVDDNRDIDHNQPEEIYTIAHFTYGVAIRGEMPPLMDGYLCQIFQQRYNYDVMDVLIAEALNAVMVLTTVDKSQKWRKLLNITADD